jgi:hypothetical protein
MTDVLSGTLATVIFTALGAALLLAGFLLVDWLTPGNLREQIWVQRNRNAALFLSSAIIGVAAIVFTSIITTYPDVLTGTVSTASFGALGLVLMAVAVRLIDVLTPGSLGDMLVDPEPHPAVWVSSAINVAVALIVCAAIS